MPGDNGTGDAGTAHRKATARFWASTCSGGFLGIGKDHFLVPVDVITAIEPERVRIDRDRARLSDVPAYDPDLAREGDYYSNVYGWWGAPPYWGAGYTYPYPYY